MEVCSTSLGVAVVGIRGRCEMCDGDSDRGCDRENGEWNKGCLNRSFLMVGGIGKCR
jgi:hypothetical protein